MEANSSHGKAQKRQKPRFQKRLAEALMEGSLFELRRKLWPSIKVSTSSTNEPTLNLQWLCCNPAENYENFKLELMGASKPPKISSA